jgi:ubiquinone/menaquinone biosynthesis C-methylase UbiE
MSDERQSVMSLAKWPKTFPPLTEEQKRISDDFMKYWHEVLPRKYGIVDRFNHTFAVRHAPPDFQRTLEVGAGNGEHLAYERLTAAQRASYVALDIRENMIAEFSAKYPDVKAVVADCQKRMPYVDGHFDRILAIHVLEHLPDLPSAVRDLYRLCDKQCGVFTVVIPCEGSFAYTLARRISAQWIFESRYKQSYRWFIEREHINFPAEIFAEIYKYFEKSDSAYFPLSLKVEFCNLCIGANFRPRSVPLD